MRGSGNVFDQRGERGVVRARGERRAPPQVPAPHSGLGLGLGLGQTKWPAGLRRVGGIYTRLAVCVDTPRPGGGGRENQPERARRHSWGD